MFTFRVLFCFFPSEFAVGAGVRERPKVSKPGEGQASQHLCLLRDKSSPLPHSLTLSVPSATLQH